MYDLKKLAEESTEYLLKVRRHLHEYPELSLEEYETSRYIQEELAGMGIPYRVIDGRSIIAEVVGDLPGKTIGIRGDIDALPIQEQTGLPFSSKIPGKMHACGHDCHGAMVLAVGKILNQMKPELKGTVKLIFQEGEEVLAGALNIVKTDYIDDVDTLLALHVDTELDTGKFASNYGYFTGKGGRGEIIVRGTGGHSSQPHLCVNALMVAAQIINNLNQAVAYEFPSRDRVSLTPTIFEAGQKDNIIPGEARIVLNARYYEDRYDQVMDELLRRIAEGTARAHKAEAEVSFTPMGKSTYNDEACLDRAIAVAQEMGGTSGYQSCESSMGGEDFAFLLDKAPGVLLWLGAGKQGNIPHHSEYTVVDEEALPYGVEFFLRYIFRFLDE